VYTSAVVEDPSVSAVTKRCCTIRLKRCCTDQQRGWVRPVWGRVAG
jgi:hypothetical protein